MVVIAGAGPLGLGMVAAARLKQPGLLIALDLIDHRLEVAQACGADLTMNPNKVDVVEEVRKLTEGYGCDVYIEATGNPAAVPQGLQMIRKLGTFVEFSVLRDAGDGRLDDHRRHEGAGHPRLAPGARTATRVAIEMLAGACCRSSRSSPTSSR